MKKICQTTEEKERRSASNKIEAFVLSGFRRKKIRIFIYFLKIMLTWKTVGVSEVSVLYILIKIIIIQPQTILQLFYKLLMWQILTSSNLVYH